MKILKETLEALKKAMPHGSQAIIAEEKKYTCSYVNRVLSGDVQINEYNINIIYAAQKIIRNQMEKEEKLKKSIEKTLGK